jgi:hypothetical protein
MNNFSYICNMKLEGYNNYRITKDGKIFNQYNKQLKYQDNGQGRMTVCLVNDEGKQRRLQVHRLIAMTYLPNPNQYPIVMHKDDNPLNNQVDNLMWGTQKMNIDDMITKGRSKQILTSDNIKFIKQNHYKVTNQYQTPPAGKYTSSQLAKMFNVTKSAIMPIITNKRYATLWL